MLGWNTMAVFSYVTSYVPGANGTALLEQHVLCKSPSKLQLFLTSTFCQALFFRSKDVLCGSPMAATCSDKHLQSDTTLLEQHGVEHQSVEVATISAKHCQLGSTLLEQLGVTQQRSVKAATISDKHCQSGTAFRNRKMVLCGSPMWM